MFRIKKTGLPAFLFMLLTLYGAASESIDLNLYLQDVRKAGPPRMFGNYVIFSCATRIPARVVGARFSHENFRYFHTFRRNENNIYVFALPAPAQSQMLKYRIMIDGVWGADPANPLRESDEQGIVFSLFAFQREERPTTRPSPLLLSDGVVEFNLAAASGSIVSVTGDFNGYDPFIHRLAESSPGLFSIRLKLLPGRHYYYFMVNGVRMIDPQNDQLVYDADKKQYSVIIID